MGWEREVLTRHPRRGASSASAPAAIGATGCRASPAKPRCRSNTSMGTTTGKRKAKLANAASDRS
eukprot:4445095-Alexandrium_andersonii.AAC.1